MAQDDVTFRVEVELSGELLERLVYDDGTWHGKATGALMSAFGAEVCLSKLREDGTLEVFFDVASSSSRVQLKPLGPGPVFPVLG
jgi:hypothetical protein